MSWRFVIVILTAPVYLIHLDFNQLKSQAIFVILAVLVIKRVQCVLHKLHAKCAIIRTPTMTYGTPQKTKRSSVLNVPKQSQVCPSLFLQFNMRISVIYETLSVSCRRDVSVLSPLASNSWKGSHMRSPDPRGEKLHQRGLSSVARLWSNFTQKREDVGNQFLFPSKEENEEEDLINFHPFQIAVYWTLFVTGFQ